MSVSIQENKRFAELIVSEGVQFGCGDLNLVVPTDTAPSHKVMSQITAKTGLQYHPTLQYSESGRLCQENVSNVHDSNTGHCYDMCLVPRITATFEAQIFAIPGDAAYLRALRTIFEENNILHGGHVVHYHNQTRSDHHIMAIMSQ